jgi:glycine/D-amino acid oxidase-like deaminating enzyme
MVVGGGMVGLAAAEKLTGAGLQIQFLAVLRNRIIFMRLRLLVRAKILMRLRFWRLQLLFYYIRSQLFF